MMPFVYYLLKVALCSGVLLGYYWLALHNKTFHRWNRFYLLTSVVLSLVAPLLKINFWHTDVTTSYKVFKILNAVTVTGEEAIIESGRSAAFPLTTAQLFALVYALVSAILLLLVTVNAIRIFRLLRSYPKRKLDKITFLNTHAPGTPFSFFNCIVWNCTIDIGSETGQQIFRHELAHVQQRHTWDKLFLLLILIPFWANPFFWIIRNELHALHEFSADEKAMQTHDAAALAQLILSTTFPQQQHLFTNSFFQSTIKRRIAMFTKLQNPSVSYVSRILALPLLLLVIAAFSLKTDLGSTKRTAALDNPITVVIDAGHGDKSGARTEGIYEDDVALAIAKKIKEQNKNGNIEIFLTRETDIKTDLRSRVQMAADKKADVFLSIHLDASKDMQESGIHVYIPSRNPTYQQQSKILGSVLLQELEQVHNIQQDFAIAQTKIWVLDSNVCPAVSIECGYLTNKKDRDFITKDENQTAIANKILDAIARYRVLKNPDKTSGITDTVPKQTTGIVIRNVTLEEAKRYNGIILIDDRIFKGNLKDLEVKEVDIEHFSMMKGLGLPEKLRTSTSDSVLLIATRVYSDSLRQHRDPATKPIFTNAETDPKFPQTNGGWEAFLQKNLDATVPVKKGVKAGTYKVIVQFIVDEAGKLSDIKPLTKHGYGMEEEVVRLMKMSPDWIPANQNGRNVTAYVKQPVTFVIAKAKPQKRY